MENEDMSIDVDEFVDSGIEEAGEKLEVLDEQDGFRQVEEEETTTATDKTAETETETETKEEPAEKETETPKETDSAIAKLIGVKTEEEEQRVPVEDHIKLRKRAQAAEARVKELEERQTTTQTEEDKSGDNFLGELEDGDLVRAEEVKKAIPKIVDSAVKIAVGQISESIEQERAVAKAKIQAERAVQSEKEFAKNTPDYDQVTKAAIKLNFLTAEDKQKILDSDEPAKICYEISKKRLTDIQETLGITPKTTSKGTTTEKETGEETEEEMSDDEVFDAVYGDEE